MKYLFLLLLTFSFISCSNYDSIGREEPLAKVGDQYLYPSDLPEAIASGLTLEDSTTISNTFINKWIRKQLLLQHAELNISTNQQREINNQLEETRASLIIYQYEKQMINQKLDTLVEDDEINSYYNENISNFVLNENIIKALFVKLSKDAPNISRVSRWYRSERNEDLTELESYCYQYAEKYDYFDEDWISFDDLLRETPMIMNDQERYLRNNSFIETEDSLFLYFVNIRDYRLKTSSSPLEFITDNIRTIILNNRKIQFLIDLENNIYNDAINRQEFEVY